MRSASLLTMTSTRPLLKYGLTNPIILTQRQTFFSTTSARDSEKKTKPEKEPLVLVSDPLNGVTTITMNCPKKLNGWTFELMSALFAALDRAAACPATKVAVLTGRDPYYCAGVNLSSMMSPMHPRKLHALIIRQNEFVPDQFISFPKPLIAAVNGPTIGAGTTSATLADAIVASERATFSTPFAALRMPAEGCSSVHFERIMGGANARRMLGDEGWKPTAAEAKEAGFVREVVPHDQLLPRAQALGEQWAKEGRRRWMREVPGRLEEYRAVNARESRDLADAFLAVPFLDAQYRFLRSRGKTSPAAVFWALKTFRPLWAKML